MAEQLAASAALSERITMAAKLVSIFYSQLLYSEKPLDPVTQKSVFRYFLRAKKYKELGRLAERVDTIAELDAKLGSRNEIGVITGWLRRPGRTREEIVSRLTKEKRVSALLPLASMEDLPDEVYERVALQDSAKISVALLANKSVPRPIRTARAAALFADPNFGYWNAVEAAKTSHLFDPGFVADLAPQVSSLTGAHFCLSNGKVASTDASRFLAMALAAEKTAQSDVHRYNRATYEDVLCLLVETDLVAKDVEVLTKALRRGQKRYQSSYGRNDFARGLSVLESRNSEFEVLLAEFVSCTDPVRTGERFTALFQAATDYQKERVLSAGCRHQHLSSALMFPHVEDVRGTDEEALIREWERRGDTTVLGRAMISVFYGGHWLEVLKDPLPVLVEAFHACGSDDPPYWLARDQLILDHPERVVDLLGWGNLLVLASEDDKLRGAVSEKVTSRLGSDPLLWENFDSLAEDFSGTLGELLDTVEKI